MFYMLECGACQQALPVWEHFASAVKSRVNVGSVIGPMEPKLVRRFNLREYPSFFFISYGRMWQYKGPRTIENWSNFAYHGYKRDPAQYLPSTDQEGGVIFLAFEDLGRKVLHSSNDWIIAFADNSTKSRELVSEWSIFGDEMMDSHVSVGFVDQVTPSQLKQYSFFEGSPAVKLFSKGKVFGYYGEYKVDDLLMFAYDTYRESPFEWSDSEPISQAPEEIQNVFALIGFASIISLGLGFLFFSWIKK